MSEVGPGFKTAYREHPRLTADLSGIRHPFKCQRCSITVGDDTRSDRNRRTAWQEHDRDDRPEPGRFVVLCKACADEVIEPHQRLYRQLTPHEPAPGVMSLCGNCPHRDGVRCASPLAAFNGGGGITITGPEPSHAHISYRDKQGRRCGRWELIYPGPATACSGKGVEG